MSNGAMSVGGKYARFEELVDTDEAFLIRLLQSPSKALLEYGFNDSDKDRAKVRQVRQEILSHARSKLKGLKR